MGSLGHRAIVQYIEINDLTGLKTFLDTRQGHVHVDDRDEVRKSFSFVFKFIIIFL